MLGGNLHVARDAHIEGNILNSGVASSVKGTLYQEGLLRDGTSYGKLTEGKVTLSPPCDCDPSQLLDIAKLVAWAKDHNDNAVRMLDVDAFGQLAKDTTITLDCGRYYLSGVSAVGRALTLKLKGRVALFVDGAFLADALNIELERGAEIDLYVSGNFIIDKTTSLGDPTRPRAVRVYVGGAGNVLLGNESNTFVGNLYAPRASVLADPKLEVYGSIFANNVIGSRLVVHYDRGIQRAGDDCHAEEPPTCDTCSDCNDGKVCGQAGECTSCTSDAQCCAPLACDRSTGRCGALIF